MNASTEPVPGGPASSSQPSERRARAVVAAQAGILILTYAMGILGVFVAENAWFVALAQAAAGIGLIHWLTRRHGSTALVVPVVSVALTLGLAAVSYTVAVACSDRALTNFRQVRPPPGVSFVTAVSPSQGCMVEMTFPGIERKELFRHYRREFEKRGWRINDDFEGGLRAERDDVYADMYGPERGGRGYVILGRCGEWGNECLAERSQ